jgi:hypothetical protein
VGGYAWVRLPTANAEEVPVYPEAADWNAAAYDTRLLRGVDHVITTSAVRARFASDTVRFQAQARFYALLDRSGRVVARFDPSPEVDGPSITIYELDARANEVVREAGPLDALWWTLPVPAEFRTRAIAALRASSPPLEPIPGLPLWAHALRESYAARYRPFANDLAYELYTLGRVEPAAALALGTITVFPEDLTALELYVRAERALGDSSAATRAIDRSSAVLARVGPLPSQLAVLRAQAPR